MVYLVKAMVSPVIMYGCESWAIRKAEYWRIDAFELWCWRRLLRVPWTARRSNQSILKEISLKYSLEGLTLKLKLQYFGHLMQRADSLEKILMLGGIEGRRRRGRQRMRWLDDITNSMDIWVWASSGWWWRIGRPLHGVTKSQTQLSNWTTRKYMYIHFIYISIIHMTDWMISIPLYHEIFIPCFMSLDMFQWLLVYSLWELE